MTMTTWPLVTDHHDVNFVLLCCQDSSPHRHDLGSHQDKKHDRLENITQVMLFLAKLKYSTQCDKTGLF